MTHRIALVCALSACMSTHPAVPTGEALAIVDTDAVTNWYATQGERPIRDEDLFRITGDQRSLEATQEVRSHARIWQAIGVVGVAIGMAIASGGFATGVTPQGEEAYLFTGISAVGLGSWAFTYGTARRSSSFHAVDRTTAKDDVQRYNDDLHRAAGAQR